MFYSLDQQNFIVRWCFHFYFLCFDHFFLQNSFHLAFVCLIFIDFEFCFGLVEPDIMLFKTTNYLDLLFVVEKSYMVQILIDLLNSRYLLAHFVQLYTTVIFHNAYHVSVVFVVFDKTPTFSDILLIAPPFDLFQFLVDIQDTQIILVFVHSQHQIQVVASLR